MKARLKVVDTSCIEHAPCLTCPVEEQCGPDQKYSPVSCPFLIEWAQTSR